MCAQLGDYKWSSGLRQYGPSWPVHSGLPFCMNSPPLPLDTEGLSWIPLGPGEAFKPLRFLPEEDQRVLLLRLDPGVVVPLHRHLGDVHAYNLAGHRRLDTGALVGPGGYVYEPVGNEDSWTAVGDEPVVVHIVTYGPMQYPDRNGRVLKRDSSLSLKEGYDR